MKLVTYQLFPNVFEPLFSANLRSCAALNYIARCMVSVSIYFSETQSRCDSWSPSRRQTNARYGEETPAVRPLSGGVAAALLPKVKLPLRECCI
jgi:hypothetical protein